MIKVKAIFSISVESAAKELGDFLAPLRADQIIKIIQTFENDNHNHIYTVIYDDGYTTTTVPTQKRVIQQQPTQQQPTNTKKKQPQQQKQDITQLIDDLPQEDLDLML